MNDSIVQVNENLVCNGDFEERFECWARTGVVAIGTAYYDNTPVKHIKAPKGAGVTQDLTLPRDPGGNGVYWLSFLWESSFSQSGWVRISQGETEHYRIELKPDGEPEQAQQREGFGSGPERRFSPTLHEVDLTSDISSSKPLRIEIYSSTESSSPFGELWVTRVKVELKLAPLELQEITLDGVSFPPLRKMYLCQGASSGGAFGNDALITPHMLGFVPVPDNPWVGTPVALSIDNNPQGAIVATPAWDTQQALDAPWTLDCPLIDDQDYEFTLSLRNRYTAQAYEIPVSLGHHRLIFRDELKALYYPLIEQSVRLGVQVASYYTGQPFAGLTVNWATTEQGVLAAAVTDEQGWAYFDYEAKAAGDFVIEASVISLYYEQGVWTQTFDVLVLGEDPWAQLTVFENNEIRDWIDNSYPNRGSTHSIDVMLAANSRLRGSDFYLHWHGDKPGQLGVVVSPPLETSVPMPIDGGGSASWTLNCEDRRDGIFELSLVCSKLLLPSPRKRMSLARNRIRIKEVRQGNSPVVEEHESAYLRLQVVHVTDQGDGEPVIGALVEWQTADSVVQSQTGSGGWGSLKFYTREPGTHGITAAVRAHESAAPHECEFSVTAIARSSWKDKVNITFDRGLINQDLGVFCKRGLTHSLVVTALAGSPLIGQEITLAWGVDESDIGLAISELGEPRILRADEPLIWTLSSEFAKSRSSMFGLRLLTDSLEDRELLGRLVSPEISDEFTLELDHMSTDRGQLLYPCLGAVHRYIFRTNPLSTLVGLDMDLQWYGTPASELDIVLDPPPNSYNVIDESGMTWTLDCLASRVAGSFRVNFVLGLWGKTDSTTLHLGHNKLSIETVRESAVFPIVGQEPAWMWAKVRSDFSEDAMVQVPTQWKVGGHSEEHVTADDGWAGFAYGATTGGSATVEVSVTSPYDNATDTRSMEVCSLADDPWARLQFSMDNGPAQPFGQDTGFARRKLTHIIDVTAPEDTFLSGRKLTLGMVGAGPEALGIRFTQSVLGLPRVFSREAGFTDSFMVDDKRNGSFGLFLACESLARWSPVNAMSVGEGAQVVKIAERSRVSQTLYWGEAVSEQITVVSAISGRPMVGMNVVWRSPDLGEVATTTNFYGEARIRFVPKTPGAAQLTATVGDTQYSESISLSYFLHEPREIKELVSDDSSGYPGQEVSARVYVVSAITGNPLANVEVSWELPGVDIAPTTTDSDGIANVVFRLSAQQPGLLDAGVRGGLAGWEVSSIPFTLKAHERMMTEIRGSGSYPVDQSVPVSFRIVSIPDGKPIVGQKVLWGLNSVPDGSSFSTEDGWVRKSYSSQGMVGYKIIRASVVDEQGAVLDEEVFRLQFFDSESP
jgi:hypothetical protein